MLPASQYPSTDADWIFIYINCIAVVGRPYISEVLSFAYPRTCESARLALGSPGLVDRKQWQHQFVASIGTVIRNWEPRCTSLSSTEGLIYEYYAVSWPDRGVGGDLCHL